MLTKEEKKELEHLEDLEPRSDFDVWFGVNDFDLRIEFCKIKGIKPHSAINGTELEGEFKEFCLREYNLDYLEIDLDI